MVEPRRLLVIFFLSTLLIAYSNANVEEIQKGTEEGDEEGKVGGQKLLFSGAIHYPRSTPDMWPDLIKKAKQGGINTIETYVFWNGHEPVEGQYNFEGEFDLVKFIKLIHEHKLYAVVRVGPFIQAEWNHGGLPYWLREVPGIIFRSDNEPFKKHMKRFVTMIVDKLKQEKLFAPQGGPIILAQIENEYNTIQRAFREKGDSYVQWAGKLALSLNANVPWIMCKQRDAPDPVINTCNGRHCGDTFYGPNKRNKPALWTENWTAQYRVFGDPPSQRSAEDLAYSVARFFSKNGSMVNYYMYYGGTNFGRTSASFTTTRYYDEAPLDEFGLQREPKWGHLKDVHRALSLCKRALFWGVPTTLKLGPDQQVSNATIWSNRIGYLEEGNPKDVHIVTVNRDTICSAVSEIHPPSPRLFETKNGTLQPKVNDLKPRAELICPGKKQIVAVEFASYGDPFGACGAYFIGNCTAPESKQVVEKYCLGKPSCQIPLDSIHFSDQNGACTHLRKTLAVQVKCA
ncbi:hypothetical protein GOBAR_DD06627 [Gossypium barbadense]|nr:hypothetical protein GOBAR_DD06627 [Gossypium barbadense]